MDRNEIIMRLTQILDKMDTDRESIVTRGISRKHEDKIELLIEHVSMVVSDLRFDAEASRRELFEVRKLLEE